MSSSHDFQREEEFGSTKVNYDNTDLKTLGNYTRSFYHHLEVSTKKTH